MISLPKVRFSLWKNPFYWPKAFHAGIFLVLAFLYLFLFAFTRVEQKHVQENKKLFEQRLQDREREIFSLKLSGLEPYQWKPALQCKTLAHEKNHSSGEVVNKVIKEKNSLCFNSDISFVKQNFLAAQEENPLGYVFNPQQKQTLSLVAMPDPCLICHRKEQNKMILFAHSIIPPSTAMSLNRFFYSAAFYWFSMTLILLFFLFHLLRLYFFFRGDLRVVSLAILNPDMSQLGMEQLSKNLTLDAFFLYKETGQGYMRGYISLRKFRYWLKIYLTPNVKELEEKFGTLRAAAFVTPSSSLLHSSSEGMRIAQMIAAKPQENAFLLDHELLKGSALNEVGQKAVWKSQNKKIEFRFLKLK